MTYDDMSQLRQDLMAQFHEMMAEPVPPDPDVSVSAAQDWAFTS